MSVQKSTMTAKSHKSLAQTSRKDVPAMGGISLCEQNYTLKAPADVEEISYEQFMCMNKTVKAGELGDSQFYKNCASVLWPDSLDLGMRSATGAACPNMPGKQALKECTPSKKEYLLELLTLIIKSEVHTFSEEDFNRRIHHTRVMEFLRAKIKTVKRDLVSKGLFL